TLPLVFAGAGVGFGAAPFALITGTAPFLLGAGLLAAGNVPVATGSLLPLAPFLLAELADAFLFPAAPGALLAPACDPLAFAGCEPFFAVCGTLAPAVWDAGFTGCALVCEPALAACVAVPAGVDAAFPVCPLGCDPVLVTCAPLPDGGCEPFLAAGDPLPAVAGVGEGEVLAWGAGDFAGVAAAFAGVGDGLGFACWLEFPAAPVFWAVAVAAKTIASATT